MWPHLRKRAIEALSIGHPEERRSFKRVTYREILGKFEQILKRYVVFSIKPI